MCVLPALVVIAYYQRRNNIGLSPLLTKRIEMSWLTLTAYCVGVLIIIAGAIRLRIDIVMGRVSLMLVARYLFGPMCMIWGVLICIATWFRYRGGLWSVVGAFLVGGAFLGTMSLAEARLRGWHYDSLVAFYVKNASCWAFGVAFLVLGHRRHRKKQQVRPNTALEPTPTAA
jgi:hypothetical protein